jgi:hypothetical protein
MREEIAVLADPHVRPEGGVIAAFINEMMRDLRPVPQGRRSSFGNLYNPCIYGLFDGDELVYLGQSRNLAVRLRDHITGDRQKTFTTWGHLPVASDDLDLVERRLIQRFQPRLNKKYNNPRNAWGFAYADDIADALNVSPGTVHHVCAENKVPTQAGCYEIRPAIWHVVRALSKNI